MVTVAQAGSSTPFLVNLAPERPNPKAASPSARAPLSGYWLNQP
ncbi:hypothetical Protein YC6258_02683 [Gynuella sunshinyii YC6258]|uniref:Uncharacterized protein n=1 Tax=Gynuella sunshinyii YC6258 TaxID=1445510 RepID=A0A0C5VKC9_9GAMM|nr:hypothetical Protein YC6258_02683 [Gynuella sunshinyii YC6258]